MTKELEILDHVTEGEKNILSQYEDSTLFKAFLRSFNEEVNFLETEVNLFLTKTNIQTAEGAQLNGIGRILNAKTRPPDDALFRVLLNALAAAYNSNGTAEDIRAVILIAADAESIFIDETPGGGVFTVTIFGPNFIFGQDLLFDIVNLAKPLGVEFVSFVISDSFSEPTFSFVGDNRPNSEGFAVAIPIQIPDSYYLGFVFPGVGAIGTPNRVWLTSSSGDVRRDLTLNIAIANTNSVWNADLLLNFDAIGGQIEFANNDAGANKIRLVVLDEVDVYNMNVIGNYQHHEFRIVMAGVKKSVIQINSTVVTEEILASEFIEYDETDSTVWTTNNPSGLGKTFIEDPSGFPSVYATSGGGRYSVLIS